MKEGRYNRVLARMMERVERVSERMSQDLKGSRPFDQQPLDPKQSIYNFSQLTSQDITTMRQNMGNDVVDNYLLDMAEKMRRYQ